MTRFRSANFAPVFLLAFMALANAPARAQAPALADVSLDRVVVEGRAGATLTLDKIDATSTNLTHDELASLFKPDTPKDAASAVLAKMQAAKLTIPSAVLATPEGTATLRGVVAEQIANGHVAKASSTGFEGSIKDGADLITFLSRSIELRDLDLSSLIARFRAGDLYGSPRVGAIDWKGFEASFPDRDTPADAQGGNIFKFSLGSLTAQNTYDGDTPLKGSAKGEHLVIVAPPASQLGAALAGFGYDKLDLGFNVVGDYDKSARNLNLKNYTLDAAGAGALSISGSLANLPPTMFTGDRATRAASARNATLSKLGVHYVDAGLFARLNDYFATAQGQTKDEVKAQWSLLAKQILPLLLGGDAGAQKLSAALAAFVEDPKAVTISATAKGAPLKIADLLKLSDPGDLLARLDISAKSGE